MSDKKYQALYAYALKQQGIIKQIGGSLINRSLLMLIIFAYLFAYLGATILHSFGLWIVCLSLVVDAIWAAIKMSDAGF